MAGTDPLLKREGNLRLASIPSAGYPADPWALAERVRGLLDEQELDTYGPVTVWFSRAPGDDPSSAWECSVGLALTGMARSIGGMVVEDYRQLHALSLVHDGAIRDLPQTWKRLHDHGRSLGRQVRPYWRLALRDRRLADGNLLPVADVAVFLDQ
jgi:hypothetical protein